MLNIQKQHKIVNPSSLRKSLLGLPLLKKKGQHFAIFRKCIIGHTASVPVLPSRSALSDLGLIADLFKKNAPKLVLFLPEKSAFWPKNPKSLIFYVLAFHKNQKILENFLKYGIFSNKS